MSIAQPSPQKMSRKENQIRVELYEPRLKACWDEFVLRSKNGVFLFFRDYLEYHADRFRDFSLLFYEDDRLAALMPANRVDGTVVSHGGLTFGGIISGARMTTTLMLRIFPALISYLREQGIKKLIYKAIPHIYHILPAEEDLYALFVHNAHLIQRDVSSTVDMSHKVPLARIRRKILKHAQCEEMRIERSMDFSRFMTIAETSLQARHGRSPVHKAAEIQLLAGRFPENIKLFAALRGEEMLGGVIMYESQNVAHGQYRHATDEGMELGALDLLMDALLHEIYLDKRYVDFGISTVDNGRTLNLGLIKNKEGYGARATVYDAYELDLAP
jgi:hypothetical protein